MEVVAQPGSEPALPSSAPLIKRSSARDSAALPPAGKRFAVPSSGGGGGGAVHVRQTESSYPGLNMARDHHLDEGNKSGDTVRSS